MRFPKATQGVETFLFVILSSLVLKVFHSAQKRRTQVWRVALMVAQKAKNLSLVRIGALPTLGLFLSTKQRAPGPRLTLARAPRTVYVKAMSGCDPSV